MRVNIYYGGRGLLDDPTIYVMNKLTQVLEELRVEVVRYNLFEEKQGITRLTNTLKDADGVILATTIEWLGIGGYMQEFLDACWFYGDKDQISKLYMMPVVMSNAYGERDGEFALIKSWEVLGGKCVPGLCAYVADSNEFEANEVFGQVIEKQAEALYRYINQKREVLQNSYSVVKQNLLQGTSIELTPQESEQLSVYASDETYVKKQKEDIEELKQLFKGMLGSSGDGEDKVIAALKEHFQPEVGFQATYSIQITDQEKTLIVEINNEDLNCYYGEKDEVDVTAKTTSQLLDKITSGTTSFQKAFMAGDLAAKGNFKTLRMFDVVFVF